MSQFWGSISEYSMEKGLNCENHQCLFCGNIFLGFWKHDYEKRMWNALDAGHLTMFD